MSKVALTEHLNCQYVNWKYSENIKTKKHGGSRADLASDFFIFTLKFEYTENKDSKRVVQQ